MDTDIARRMWWALEPYHAMVYFAPEARAAYGAAGLKGGWMGYFASRSAPMGPVPAEVVVATFYHFHPRLVHRAIPDAWTLSSPERVLAARYEGADTALRRLLGPVGGAAGLAEAAGLARRAAEGCDPAGRALFAGHASLPWPDGPRLALWHAATPTRAGPPVKRWRRAPTSWPWRRGSASARTAARGSPSWPASRASGSSTAAGCRSPTRSGSPRRRPSQGQPGRDAPTAPCRRRGRQPARRPSPLVAITTRPAASTASDRLPASRSSSSAPTRSRRQPWRVRTAGSGRRRRADETIWASSLRPATSS